MGCCRLCETRSPLVSGNLGLCLACIRTRPAQAIERAHEVHRRIRRELHQVPQPPRDPQGTLCPLCARACSLGEGRRGYCGLRTARGGRLRHQAGHTRRGLLHWYRDPLPTNCVADFFCQGHDRRGQHNLAVFYGACTLNCLFCQNWTFRALSAEERESCLSADELAAAATRDTHCICFFGGDPSAQMPHALAVSRELARRGVVICFETNGMGHPRLMRAAARLVLATGGTLKIDLKALDPTLHEALTGSPNCRVLENFRAAARILATPDGPPRLCAATLLLPGYLDTEEVGRIARFIAEIDQRIPYSLLAFHPHFLMTDLPCTSWSQAEEAERAARAAGLLRVRVGNRHLLSGS